jgi:hypothetical protein
LRFCCIHKLRKCSFLLPWNYSKLFIEILFVSRLNIVYPSINKLFAELFAHSIVKYRHVPRQNNITRQLEPCFLCFPCHATIEEAVFCVWSAPSKNRGAVFSLLSVHGYVTRAVNCRMRKRIEEAVFSVWSASSNNRGTVFSMWSVPRLYHESCEL